LHCDSAIFVYWQKTYPTKAISGKLSSIGDFKIDDMIFEVGGKKKGQKQIKEADRVS